MLNLLHIRQFLDGLVIAASEPVHQTVFLAAGLDADNDFISLLPLMDVFRYHFHRVLEIRHHLNNAVSGDLEHSVIGGIELAEIPGIEYGLDARIVRAQAPDDIPGAVCGIIINEYQLIVILRQLFFQDFRHCPADRAYIFRFIITGNQYADFLHISLCFFFLYGFFDALAEGIALLPSAACESLKSGNVRPDGQGALFGLYKGPVLQRSLKSYDIMDFLNKGPEGPGILAGYVDNSAYGTAQIVLF